MYIKKLLTSTVYDYVGSAIDNCITTLFNLKNDIVYIILVSYYCVIFFFSSLDDCFFRLYVSISNVYITDCGP